MSSPRKMRSKEALHLAKVELIVSVICMAAQCSIQSNDKKKDEAARYITDLLSPSVLTQCFKTTQKVSSLRAKQVTLISKKPYLGFTFLPLINSLEFLQILAIYSTKRITKNSKEFSRGKNVSPKVSKVIDM